jgi:hypothetical protein
MTEKRGRIAETLMRKIARDIEIRGCFYDSSKTNKEELELYNSGKLDEAYRAHLLNRHNRHHVEHFSDGMSGMNLVDLIEMLVDWTIEMSMAEEPNLNIYEFIGLNAELYGYDGVMSAVLENTVNAYISRF